LALLPGLLPLADEDASADPPNPNADANVLKGKPLNGPFGAAPAPAAFPRGISSSKSSSPKLPGGFELKVDVPAEKRRVAS